MNSVSNSLSTSFFIVVDNNDAKEDVFREVTKRVKGLLRKPVRNGRARQWIKNQLDLKRR